MPKGPVETPITDQEIAFAHLLLAGTITDRKAAEAVGINPGRAAYVKAKPRVKAYMEEHRASVRAGMVQHEVDALSEFNIGREQIMAQYWGLARLEPEKTNGNIAGQVRALDSLREMLGFVGPQLGERPDGEGEGDPKPDIYVARWMRKPGSGGTQDEGETEIDREPSMRREAVPSSPEPPPKPARPGAVSQRPTMRPGGNTMNHAVEPTEPAGRIPGAHFGRFQGLG
jgi:hypothetical protein